MKLLIMIPAYNEALNIRQVVQHLQSICPEYDYLIINDGSRDATARICRENRYPVLDLPVNGGLSNAIHAGMCYAKEKGYDMALQFDGDGQHDARKQVAADQPGGSQKDKPPQYGHANVERCFP